MRKILILGAGRSSTTLINYLISQSKSSGFDVFVADENISVAKEKIGNGAGTALQINVEESGQLSSEIEKADLVISMLPAKYHDTVAEVCLHHSKHLITASYVSEKMKSFSQEAASKDVILLNECGLDTYILEDR